VCAGEWGKYLLYDYMIHTHILNEEGEESTAPSAVSELGGLHSTVRMLAARCCSLTGIALGLSMRCKGIRPSIF